MAMLFTTSDSSHLYLAKGVVGISQARENDSSHNGANETDKMLAGIQENTAT